MEHELGNLSIWLKDNDIMDCKPMYLNQIKELRIFKKIDELHPDIGLMRALEFLDVKEYNNDELFIDFNNIRTLHVSKTNLKKVNIQSNSLTNINLAWNKIESLELNIPNIKIINLEKNKLKEFNHDFNQLNSIYLNSNDLKSVKITNKNSEKFYMVLYDNKNISNLELCDSILADEGLLLKINNEVVFKSKTKVYNLLKKKNMNVRLIQESSIDAKLF